MSDAVAVDPASGREPTPMQRALLASQRRYPTQPLQNMALVSHLDGPIDADRLADAFGRVVRANPVLATRIVDGAAGRPRVVIDDADPVSEIVDLERSAVTAWARERAWTVIDLAYRGYDSVILRHEDDTVSWYLALHHVITDATSSQLVFRTTADVYHGGVASEHDYYAWWSAQPPDRRADAARQHWGRRREAPRAGRLYRAVTRPSPTSHRGEVPLRDRSRIEERLEGDLAAMSADLGWTTLLVTTAAVYLHRVTGADEMAIGLPVHGRSTAETRRLIGPLMEVFPIDITVAPDDTYRTLHRRVGRAVMSTLRHARPGTAPSSADVEAVVNVIPGAGLDAFGDVPATTSWIHPGASDPNHLFRLQLTAYGDGPNLLLDLNDAAAGDEHRRRAPGHVRRIIEALVDDPDLPIGASTLCDPDELADLRAWGTGPEPAVTPSSIVPDLAAAVRGRTDVVVDDAGEGITGVELWRRVESLAGWLRARGVGGGDAADRVGIELGRSADALVAILATLLAGGSYVPLDPAQPEARRRRLAERAGCAVVIDRMPETDPSVEPPPPVEFAADREAYLLFTSGSTGEPKGVPISHGGLAGYLRFAIDSYVDPRVPVVAPLFSALTFDLTVTSLFVPLLAAGRLVVIRPDGPAGLAEMARHADLTWCKATPSHLDVLLRLEPTASLRTLVVGGEAFPARLARRLHRRFPDVRVFNEYGPTEAVVGCMIHETEPDRLADLVDVPIGRPAPGVELRIVDADLAAVPIGALGELLISHPGMTRGYLDGDEPDPFVELDGQRWYRSGDLARLDDPLTCVYHGRIDEQIKTGGIRLEPVEVEHAVAAHPAIERAAVRLWSPRPSSADHHCVRCGLPSNVPGVVFDEAGVCATCHEHDRIKDQAESYFRTLDDLVAIRDRARAERTGDHDCLHLLSGGKDSTYALYRLVELGFAVRTMTLDNGFISEGAKDNVRRSVAELGVDHEFVTSDAMNEIFRDSLERHSNVCHGCYKTMYTLATTRADELGIPVIVTGLSRGQLFETRLIPQQFGSERFDPDAIDRAVIEARRSYHRIDDGPNRLLDTSVFDADDVFDRISYVDFYRFVDVELAEMLEFLDRSAPWVRPADTGRSTNCLINAAGIHTHLTEQGYHNYAVPYAWDVRLGHKTRQEAIDELDDDLDMAAVADMLGQVGYEPAPREVLTAWFELAADASEPNPAELRSFLAERLPAFAVPSAFVAVGELPVSANGKLDAGRLPAPARVHRSGPSLEVPSETPLEAEIVSAYEQVLRIEPIGVTDDFFDLGGDSLAAIGLAVALSEQLGRTVREELVFVNTTPRTLADAIEAIEASGADPTVPPPSAIARPQGTPPPMSAPEQAMLFEYLDDPTDPRFNVGHLFRVRNDLDAQRFVGALRAVVSRQPTLHWTYGESRRQLSATDAVDVTVQTTAVGEADLDAVLRPFHVAPLDLEHGPLGRCVVQPLTDGTVAVLIVIHHIAIDAGSFELLWTQIDRVFSGHDLDPLDLDLADHAAWQESRLTDADLEPFLGEVPEPLVLGAGDSDPADRRGGYLQRVASFDAAELRAGPGATPYATALAALAVVLARRCGRTRVPIGLTVSSREHPAAAETVGLFLNTSPATVEVPPDATFASVAAAAGDAVNAALAARSVPLARVAAARRRAGLPPAPVDVLLAYEDWAACRLGASDVDHEVLATESPVVDATFFVQLHGDRVVLSVEHRSAVVDVTTAAELLEELDATIRSSIERPLAPLADATVVGTSSGAASGAASAASSAVTVGPAIEPDDRLLHELIDAQVARDASAPAVRRDEETLTYGQLAARSQRIAHELVAAGVRPGDVVGVLAARRPDTVAAIVGVLRAGAAYVAVDPDYPPDRIGHIVADAGVAVVVAPSGEVRPSGMPADVHVMVLDETDLDARPATSPDVDIGPEHLAYLIYTSGSTGAPKGVMVRHRNIVSSTNARSLVYQERVERFLLLSSFAFDSSMVGLFWTLCTGATLVLPSEGAHDDVLEIASLVDRRRISHVLALPSLYRLVLSEADATQLQTLDTVIVAGEACPFDVVARHRSTCPRAVLANEYGPTEGTVWSHVFLDDGAVAADPVPIGTPVPGVAHVVLDDSGRPATPGAAGELYIGGSGIAAGYHGRPDLTDERFVELDPALTGDIDGRWYRTGDLVRADDAGRLVFLGRSDDQLKIRGVRVEPGEVEAALRSCAGIDDAVVGLAATSSGRDLLVAWFVASGDPAPTSDALRAELVARLPDQFVPARFVRVDGFPRNANGKVDRLALADVAGAADGDRAPAGADDDMAAPTDARTAALAAIWADVLGVPAVGADDNFFDLGGDSIISLQIVARARRAGIELRPRQVFEHQTVRQLAAVAREADEQTERPDARGDVELTPIQRWFFDLDLVRPDHWNQTLTLELEASADDEALVDALDDVRARHEQLRCRFRFEEGTWRQTIEDRPAPVVVERVDAAEQEADVVLRAVEAVEGALDLASARTVGVVVARDAGVPRRVIVTIHHLVVDGVSWSTIVEDWTVAYRARVAESAPTFPPRAGSYQQWAVELAAAAADGRLDDGAHDWAPVASATAAEREMQHDEANVEAAAETVTRHLGPDVTGRLVALSAVAGGEAVSVEDIVLSAATMVVPARLGHDHLAVMLEGHGREELAGAEVDPSRTVGWFTTRFPVHLRLAPGVVAAGHAAIVASVTDQLRAIPNRGLGFGAVRRNRSDAGTTEQLPVLAMNYLGQVDRTIATDAPFAAIGSLRASIAPENRRGHLLGILAAIEGGRLSITIDHLPQHVSNAEVAALADELVAAVESLVDTLAPVPSRFDLLDQSSADAAQLDALLDRFD